MSVATVTTGRLVPRAAWTLPAAGVLLGAPWLRPWFADPADLNVVPAPNDFQSWARVATSDGYALFGFTQMLGLLCLLFGLLVLNGHLAGGRSPGWAKAGLILGVTGIVLALMLLGVLVLADPIVAALYQNSHDVCQSGLSVYRDSVYLQRWAILPDALCHWWWGPMSEYSFLFLVFPVAIASAIALWVAIWRSGLLPVWVASAFGLAYFLCIAITPFLTLIGGLLMLVAGGWIALQIGRPGAKSSALAPPR